MRENAQMGEKTQSTCGMKMGLGGEKKGGGGGNWGGGGGEIFKSSSDHGNVCL